MTHPTGTALDRQPPPGKKWHDFVKQGKCRVCKIPLYGWDPIERDVCGNSHCQAEGNRKNRLGERQKRPCKFVRLRNLL